MDVTTFVPPVVAATAALILSRESTFVLADHGDSFGTLIGADLLSLGRLRSLRAPVVSVGGAGTFDGIFLSGALAVLPGMIPVENSARRAPMNTLKLPVHKQ